MGKPLALLLGGTIWLATALAAIGGGRSGDGGEPEPATPTARDRTPAPVRRRTRRGMLARVVGTKRRLALTVGMAATLAAAVGVFAYWTTTGTGNASAVVATLNPASISGPSTTTGSVPITWDTQASLTNPSGNGNITYTVERKLGAGSYAPLGSGGCSGSLTYNTSSCTDTVTQSGTYTYRVIADYTGSWTATSNEISVSATVDTTPPTTTITFPTTGTAHNAITYAAGCTPTGICGTASDATGVQSVQVSIRQGSGAYWDGSGFNSIGEYFNAATLLSPGATSTNWGYGLSLPPDATYTIRVQASDTVGNSTPSLTYSSTATFTIDTVAPTQSVTLTAATNAFLASGTLYYRGGTTGSFRLVDAVTDSGSGAASATFPDTAASGWTHGAETVTTGTGGPPTTSYTSSTYSWAASPSNPANQTITGADAASNTVGTAITFANDSTAPTGGSLTVNGTAASGGGSTSYGNTGSFSIARSDYTDVASGLASSILTRETAPLSSSDGIADGTCGAFGSLVTLSGAPGQSGLTTNCYRYTLTGTDNVGNSTSISAVVKVDTTAPSNPSLTVSSATGSTFISGTTAFINAQAGRSGTFQVAATTTDSQSGILKVSFPSPTGFSSGGGDDTSSPYSTTYSWSGAVGASGAQAVASFNNASLTGSSNFTITPDTTSPVNGALSVNSQPASGSGTTSYYGTPSTISYTISRTDYTDAGSGLVSSTLTRESASLSSSNGIVDGTCGSFGSSTTLTGSPTQNAGAGVTTGNCYRYTLTGTDNVGNSVSISTIVKVDTSAPSNPSLTVSNATGNTFVSGTTAFINAQAGKSGAFDVAAATTDTQSGILKVSFPSPAGFASGGGDDSSSPFSTTYSWSGAVGASGTQSVTSFNNASVTGTSNFTITPDATNPTTGALTVNGQSANAGGTTSFYAAPPTISYTISRTDYTDAGSGLTSSTLVRDQATLTSNSCGSFGSATTLAGGPTQNAAAGVTAGNCYRYTLTGTDNVGNSVSISTIVKVDTSAPSTPTLAFTGLSSSTFYSGGLNTLYFRPAAGGAYTVTASSSDAETDIKSGNAGYTFSSLSGQNFTLTQAAGQASYSFGASATQPGGNPTVLATNNANVNSATASYALKSDTTAPGSGTVTVAGTLATSGGATVYNTTGSFAITARTDYTEAQSATASGLASASLVRTQATLNNDATGTCGTFASPTTITGTPTQDAGAGISNGNCYRYTLTGTDNVGNSVSVTTTVKVDTTAPTATNVALGGNNGQAGAGDTLTLTYSESMDASKFCSTWVNDGTNQSESANGVVTVTITNSGANDTLTVSSSGCAFHLGSVALNADYVSATRTFSGNGSNASSVTWNPSTKQMTITLGNPSGATNSGVAASTPSYTADTALKDLAGNAIGAGPYSGTSSRF